MSVLLREVPVPDTVSGIYYIVKKLIKWKLCTGFRSSFVYFYKMSLSCWTRGIQVLLIPRAHTMYFPVLLPACVFTHFSMNLLSIEKATRAFLRADRELSRPSMGIALTLRCLSQFTRHRITTSWQIICEGQGGLYGSLVSTPSNNESAIVLLPEGKTLSLYLFSVPGQQPWMASSWICLLSLSSYSSLSQWLQCSCCLKINNITMAVVT